MFLKAAIIRKTMEDKNDKTAKIQDKKWIDVLSIFAI